MRPLPLLTAVLAVVLVAVPAAAQDLPHLDDQGRALLYAHWPASLGEAVGGQVPVDELFPYDEPDLSEGPALPGTSARGDLPRFTYALADFYGRQGPIGTLELTGEHPAAVTLYLSADQTPWPAALGTPPQELDYGVAPVVTVETTWRIGNETIGQATRTVDLASLPEAAGGQSVHQVTVEADLGHHTVPPGAGLFVDISLYQVQTQGERAMQPLFNLHTGEAYPTAAALPLEDSDGLFLPDDRSGDEPLIPLTRQDLQELDDQEREHVRAIAAGSLGAALATIALAGTRIVRAWVRR